MGYPEFDNIIGGWICSGCGEVTSINYDDSGPGRRIAPLCKKCRDEWDSITKKELEVIKKPKPTESNWLKYKFTLSNDDDLLEMIRGYREALGLSVEVDKGYQAIADDYIKNKRYLEDAWGLDWFNSLIQSEKFKVNIAIIYLGMCTQRRYTKLPDLFKRDMTKEILKGKTLKVGVSKDESGTFLILSK